MLLYLDLNCFNRPFDDQDQERIAREAAAVLAILQRVIDGVDQLAWSAVLEFENSQNPLTDRRSEIASWSQHASVRIEVDDQVAARADELHAAGLAPLDAAHLACAERGRCYCLITCDDRLVRRVRRTRTEVTVRNPVDYLEDLERG